MTMVMDLPQTLKERRLYGFEDDFDTYVDAQNWTKLVSAGATVAAAASGFGGVLTLTTGATLNNEAAVGRTNKCFLPGKNQPMIFEGIFQYTDAHSHDAGIALGFADVINVTGFIAAAGASIISSFSGFVFYKLLGDTLWRVASSKTTTQTLNQTNVTVDDGASSVNHVFRIDVQPIDGTNVEVTFWIDDVQCIDNTSLKPIKHIVAYSSFAALGCGLFAKASTANSQVISLDSIQAYQLSRQTLQ